MRWRSMGHSRGRLDGKPGVSSVPLERGRPLDQRWWVGSLDRKPRRQPLTRHDALIVSLAQPRLAGSLTSMDVSRGDGQYDRAMDDVLTVPVPLVVGLIVVAIAIAGVFLFGDRRGR